MVFWPSLPSICRLPVVNVWCFDLLYLSNSSFQCMVFWPLPVTSCWQCMVFWPSLPSIRRLPVVNVWCFDLLSCRLTVVCMVFCTSLPVDFLLSMYGVLTFFTCRLPVVNVWCFDLLYLVYVDFLLSMYGVLTFFTCRLPVVNVWCFDLLYL